MIQTIKLCLINDDGDKIELPEKGANNNISTKIDIKTADVYTEIIRKIQDIEDEEMKTAEKFNFALELEKYLSEFRRIYKMEEITK